MEPDEQSLKDWQIAHIEERQRQPDAGDFASDEEVAETFRRLKA